MGRVQRCIIHCISTCVSIPKGALLGPQGYQHATQRLLGPVHSGKERVGFNVIHTSHACPQSLHRVVLEQLHQRKAERHNIFIK